MFYLLSISNDMSTWISTLTSTFTTLFNSAWTLVTGNWYLMAGIGIPLIAGLLFAIISFIRGR